MGINFCYDDLGMFNIGYPNIAQPNLDADQFDHVWPRSIPLRLAVYLRTANYPYAVHTVDMAPNGAWYPVALGYHDFSCDYFSLMPLLVHQRLKKREIRVMFYYHEGDNPYRIKENLDLLCRRHDLPLDCYVFISANSSAQFIDNFFYFSDHEHFFKYINRHQNFKLASNHQRRWNFTVINRTHKWWRCAVMADLHVRQLLESSLWSYNTNCLNEEKESDNPIEVDLIPGLRNAMENFITHGPYFCDSKDHILHNDHRQINDDLYTNSYCSVVIETHFDADQSQGTFLTEKTFKPIKFGQPFVLIAPAGSLSLLKKQGYRTFDQVIDNRYDDIENNTNRWLAVRKSIADIKKQNMHSWFLQCLPDVLHNQQLFQTRLRQDLWSLLQKLCHEL